MDQINHMLETIRAADDLDKLETLRVSYLGKKGTLTLAMADLKDLPLDQKKERGAELNQFKEQVLDALQSRRQDLEDKAMNESLQKDKIDITLPGTYHKTGHLHPLSKTLDEVIQIFGRMGFRVEEGNTIEDAYHNFTALNIHENHPARQEQDTFYLEPREDGEPMVLRTHTSPVQIRTMKKGSMPIQIIAPGRTYRSDYDQTHTPMFHQVEGLMIGEGVTMGHLKGCLARFLEEFFGVANMPMRLRPSHFPFTEPSAEIDIGCRRDGGKLQLGYTDDWLEILGCGMVHPQVLDNCGIDSTKYQGFAFGMGLERITMLKYGICDLRSFFENDQRWLQHYGFLPHLVS